MKKPTATPAEPRDLSKERDNRVIPVVRKLLARLAAKKDLPVGLRQEDAEKAAKYYQELYQKEVVPLFLEAGLKLKDITYVFSLMMQPIQLLNDVTTSSFEMNRDLADAKKYGIADIDDLSVKDLDAALKGVDNKV